MSLEVLFPNFDRLIRTPEDVQRLNETILQLAVQGKLVPQDPNDEPASELLERISKEKAEFTAKGRIVKSKRIPIQDSETLFTLPSQWTWSRTLDVCHSINDGDHQPPPKSETGIPFLVISNIRTGQLDFSNTRYVPEEYYENLKDMRRPRAGDILYSIVGSLGIAVRIDTDVKFCFQRHMALFRPSTGIDSRYLYWLLQSPHVLGQAKECATGIAQLTIPMSGLRKIVIPLPPLAEQKRIVAKVDQLFAQTRVMEEKLRRAQEQIIVVNQAALHRLENAGSDAERLTAWATVRDHFDTLYADPGNVQSLRQTILQLAVQGKLVSQDPNDEPASELLRRIDAKRQALIANREIRKPKRYPPLGSADLPFAVPANWEWVRTEYATTHIVDCPHSTPKFVKSSKYHCIDTTCIIQGEIQFDKVRFVSEETFSERIRRLKPQVGDILFSREGSVGLAVIVPEGVDICLGQRMMMFRVSEEVLSEYFRMAIVSHMFVRQWEAKMTGTAARHVNIGDLKRMVIPLPPLAEQKRIVAKVDQLMTLCDALEAKLSQGQTAQAKLTAATLFHAVESATIPQNNL